ncbi:class I SAM-dependent methyltransferase [Pseudomonas kilonensis]|uniref:class I SAM-dependent methyltransferase n=1 Tax=Pseudomonas kilonensis TaxID=132476 RepID=UPI00069F5610|nr:methyltransferase domain-containing protein [Pseudomonas kilonensis]
MNFDSRRVNEMSYTEFVAFINQTNVPPGSYSTLTKWRNNSNLNAESRLLEVACTTGFSINSLVKESSCEGVGIDLCKDSINQARINAKRMGLDHNVQFTAIDGTMYESSEKFSHIVVGAGLGFFPHPEKMVENICRLFKRSGYLLASPFYTVEDIPEKMLAQAATVFGITPTTQPYKEVMQLYKGFEVYFEERLRPLQETEKELHHYCESTVERASRSYNLEDESIKATMYDRLYSIKKMSNDLRQYQGYNVLVLHYDSQHYPNRYVELF